MLENPQAFAADHPILIAWLATTGTAVAAASIAVLAQHVAWTVASRLARCSRI